MTADQDQIQPSTQTLEVSAFRFSENPPAMGEFLELLGLSPRVTNDAGTWLELQAASGSVSLHATEAAGAPNAKLGTTDLVLIAADVPAFAAGLIARAGLEVEVWDEAFGHQASVRLGERTIIINEIQADPYGYHATEPTPGPVTVVTHGYTADFDNALELLLRLGLRRSRPDDTDGSVRLESAASGAILLHRAQHGERCAIGLETTDDLERLADRLRAAGHRPHLTSDGRRIDVVDPDGQSVMITAA